MHTAVVVHFYTGMSPSVHVYLVLYHIQVLHMGQTEIMKRGTPFAARIPW